MTVYEAGYINVTAGSDQVEGLGTSWLTYCHAGDTFIVDNINYLIDSIPDNHQLILSTIYAGSTQNSSPYQIICEPITLSLEQNKQLALQKVDFLAGQTRLKYITEAPGQEMTYTAKLNDAKAYIAAGYPADASTYTWINAEAVATGTTPMQVADLIVAMAGLWSVAGAEIEGQRIKYKNTLRLATSVDEIRTALQAFTDAMAVL